jgi:hypothetical protein
MRPEGASGKGSAERGGRGDLARRAFPRGDWGDPAERLDELYHWVEQGGLRVVDWYLTDRRAKRRAARALRAGAGTGALLGAALPLLELAGAGPRLLPWGYVALLGAAACLAGDRWYGLTSGWMRSVAVAQAVQRRLETLQYDWAAESVREVLGPAEGTAGEAAERCLDLLRHFTEDVGDLVRTGTADWMLEFGTPSVPLRLQTRGGAGGAARPGQAPPAPRYPVPPGGRPSMPRQRPPEGPR